MMTANIPRIRSVSHNEIAIIVSGILLSMNMSEQVAMNVAKTKPTAGRHTRLQAWLSEV